VRRWMRSRKARWAMYAVAALLVMACIPERGTVTSKTDIPEQPGGKTVRVCVSNGKDSGCDAFKADEVKNCEVNSTWPDCKED